MTLQAHLSELISKHRTLEKELADAVAHPASTDQEIAELERKLGPISPEALSLESEEILALRHLGNQFPRLQANLENARAQVANLEPPA